VETIWNWYCESPYERVLLTFAVLNIVVQKTPWKADDDILKMGKDIFLALCGIKK